MAESWVRLWAGTTTDPKWQTIARKSGQPRFLVIALFTHLLMVANEAEERGSIRGLSIEDAASALDCDEEQVADILHAMEDRVADPGGMLSGWAKRQPSREDTGNPETGAKSSTQRSREHRENKRLQRDATQCNEAQRDATQCNAPEAEADTEAEVNRSSVVASSCEPTPVPQTTFEQPAPTRRGRVCGLLRKAGMADAAPHYLTDEAWEAILCKRSDEEIVEVALAKMAARPGQRTGLKYIAPALLEDPQPIAANARDSPPSGRRTIHDEREAVSIALTGRSQKNEHRTIANPEPRDITGESVRVA